MDIILSIESLILVQNLSCFCFVIYVFGPLKGYINLLLITVNKICAGNWFSSYLLQKWIFHFEKPSITQSIISQSIAKCKQYKI